MGERIFYFAHIFYSIIIGIIVKDYLQGLLCERDDRPVNRVGPAVHLAYSSYTQD